MRTSEELLAELNRLQLALPSGSKILDLGCGDGRYTLALKKDLEVVAVDSALDSITVAEVQAKRQDAANIHFICDDMTQIMFPDAQFDCILLLNSFHCLLKSERDQLINNIKQWLRQGSWLFISALSYEEFDTYPEKHWPKVEHNTFLTADRTFLHFFEHEEILSELQGFDIRRMVKINNGGLSKLFIVHARLIM